MISRWAYILIGNDKTGKTTFQKWLMWYLCKIWYDRLPVNLVNQIIHRNSQRKLKTLFTINRSIQEKMGEYESIDNYFQNFFNDADICILSSHCNINDILEMITQLNIRYYNVCGVFFSNHLDINTEDIAQLAWNEKILLKNPIDHENWEEQIKIAAESFSEMIIYKANQY